MRLQRSLTLPLLLPGLLAALALAGLFAGARAAAAAPLAATLYVTPTGAGPANCSSFFPCTLQTAVAQAVNGDTIIVRYGTYTGTGSAVITVSKSITLLGGWNGSIFPPLTLNPTGNPSILDGQNVRRVVGITGNVTPTIKGFTIANGNATGQTLFCTSNSAKGCGGGMFVVMARARVYDNTFIHNTALVTATTYGQGAGGGLYLEQASGAIISGNAFISNVATLVYQGKGGGLSIEGGVDITVQNNTFEDNHSAEWGGGLAFGNDADATVTGNRFEANTANSGAALYTWYAAVHVADNLVTGNNGYTAVYLGFAEGLIEANRILDNATDEAGLQLTNGETNERLTLVNNIVVNSGPDALSAFGHGAGPVRADLLHNTLVGDGTGNGVHVGSDHVTMTLTNTLISGVVTGIRRDYPLSGTVKSVRTLFDTGVISHGTATEVSSLNGAALVSAAGNIPAASAAQGAGLPTPIDEDYQGDPRPLGVGPEIGADEVYIRRLYIPLILR